MLDQRDALRNIRTFPQLIKFLRDEMEWPIESEDFEDLTFDYTPEELGIDSMSAAKIEKNGIKRLRPLSPNQPWGIFFVKFEPKRLPVVALRRILSRVVLKKRASANSAERAAWQADDLLFVSNYGEGDERQISFAHFSQDGHKSDLPTLKVLGWDDRDTPLHLDDVADKLITKLSWPTDERDVKGWRDKWASAFTLRHREVITTSKALAERLADLAQSIRARVNAVLKIESDKGPLRKLHVAFREALIHDLSQDDFADMYAQTIAYGLLTARVSRPSGLVAENLRDMVPVTNPFLRDLLESFLAVGGRKGKVDFDELGVSDVVQVLRDADMEAVLRDFGDRNPEEDPAIHFYELFLKEYDPKKRLQRGVFYTPRSVVSYIVRSVHELLQTEFGLEDGLASTVTWGEMTAKHAGLKIPKGIDVAEPFVVILDPATGTATFLVEVIDVIHRTLMARWKQQRLTDAQQHAEWNDYVARHLLPRLHGYELMMAPYAIAHMKIGLKLYETGYRFGSEERARIYLANSLEPASDNKKQREFEEWAPALAHEAQAVNAIKGHQRFTVVIGNPPYSHMTANPAEELRGIVDIYRDLDGEVIRERGAIMFERTIQDDYVKFHALADRLTVGIPAIRTYITNSAYLDNPTLRGMRCYLTNHWQATWLLDLHGDIKRPGEDDENVFDIRTGVAISIFLRKPKAESSSSVLFSDLAGKRTDKYHFLNSRSLFNTKWTTITPRTPYYMFRPQSTEGQLELQTAPLIHDIFVLKSEAIKTNRDHFVIGETDEEILSRIRLFIDPRKSTDVVKAQLGLSDNAQWSVDLARQECRKSFSASHVATVAYRPFDHKRIYYDSSVVFNPRPVLEENVLGRKNLVLLTCRRIRTDKHAHFFVTDKIVVKEMLSSADNCNSYPLYRFEKHFGKEERLTNFTPEFLKLAGARLGLTQIGQHGLPHGLTPEDIFHYAYGVFHSPCYRSRYAELLKIDFPRLPLTGSLELFRALAGLGRELVLLHLLQSPSLDKLLTIYTGPVDSEIEKISYTNGTVWIDKAQTRGFRRVPEDVWNFHIGGYQVCEKWLKDRKGHALSKDDIAHYQNIVLALSETIRIMAEIDNVIDSYGGWPAAFASTENSK